MLGDTKEYLASIYILFNVTVNGINWEKKRCQNTLTQLTDKVKFDSFRKCAEI